MALLKEALPYTYKFQRQEQKAQKHEMEFYLQEYQPYKAKHRLLHIPDVRGRKKEQVSMLNFYHERRR